MKLFEKNVGQTDKTVRLAVGMLLLLAAYFVQADLLVRGILGLVGVVMLLPVGRSLLLRRFWRHIHGWFCGGGVTLSVR